MGMRYAVYFAPAAGTALEEAGARWLGRSARTGAALPQPVVPGFSPERFAEATADPRRYGFHATLKPPFALAGGRGPDDLLAAMHAFASGRRAFSLRLAPARLGGFLALVPDGDPSAVDALAADCVRAFEPFRAPLSAAEVEKRRRAGLTAEEDANLLTWGYPYVFGTFRFHMTLTRRLAGAEADVAETAAAAHFAAVLADPVTVDRIVLFVEPGPGAPFAVAAEAPFARPPGTAP